MSGGALTDGEAARGVVADIVVVGCVTVENILRGRCGEYPASEDTERVGCAITGLPEADKTLDGAAGRTKPSTLCVKQPAANTTGSQVR